MFKCSCDLVHVSQYKESLVGPEYCGGVGLQQCMRTQLSIGLMYVQYKYERTDELRLFLSLVNIWSTLSDLLMMLLTWVDHWRLCWKMTPRCRCCRTVLSGDSLRKIVGMCAGGRLSW